MHIIYYARSLYNKLPPRNSHYIEGSKTKVLFSWDWGNLQLNRNIDVECAESKWKYSCVMLDAQYLLNSKSTLLNLCTNVHMENSDFRMA